MRKFVTYEITGVLPIKEKLLHYAKHSSRCCVLNSNAWRNNSEGVNANKYEMIVAVDAIGAIIPSGNSFDALNRFHKEKNDWLFGFLSYDLKNEVEILSSGNFDGIGFPRMHFFQPKYVFRLTLPHPDPLPSPSRSAMAEQGRRGSNPDGEGILEVGFLPKFSTEEEVQGVFQEIISQKPVSGRQPHFIIDQRVSKEEYLQTVRAIKDHIHRGDIYEMNYCMEFFSEKAIINPAEVFLSLNEASQTPYSAFYRMNDHFLL